MCIRDRAEGGLRLRPEITVDGEIVDPTAVRPVGATGLYLAEADGTGIRLTLAPVALGDGVRALLDAGGGIEVPEADTAAFAREAYPRLRRSGPVLLPPGLVLPEPEPTVLVATVAFGARDTVDYRLEWVREGVTRVPWGAHVEGDERESDLRVAVQRAWEGAPELSFAAAASLTGLCLLYTSPSPRDRTRSRMPSSA